MFEKLIAAVDEAWAMAKAKITEGDPHTAEALLADAQAAIKKLADAYGK